MKANMKNLSDRLVEIGLLPKNGGNIRMDSLAPALADALREFARGTLMMVEQVDFNHHILGKVLRITLIKETERTVSYVLPRNNQ